MICIIRKVLISDSIALTELSEQLGYATTVDEVIERVEYLLNKKDHQIVVAEYRNKVIGFITFEKYDLLYHPSGINITGLVVDKKYRNNGIGQKLLVAAEKYAIDNNLKFVRANSGFQRIEAHQFYRKNGYSNEKDQKRFVKDINI